MQLKTKDMEKIFRKLGMEIKDNHHKNAYFRYEGKMIFKTRISHTRKDIPLPVIRQIMNQFYLKEDDLLL